MESFNRGPNEGIIVDNFVISGRIQRRLQGGAWNQDQNHSPLFLRVLRGLWDSFLIPTSRY